MCQHFLQITNLILLQASVGFHLFLFNVKSALALVLQSDKVNINLDTFFVLKLHSSQNSTCKMFGY